MIPLHIADATHRMVAPPGHEGDVRPLYIAKRDGFYVSRWEPTPGEITLLLAGGSVELWIMGSQPPVALVVQPHAESEAQP